VLQRVGLEWLFRLACEPRRLWHRYLHHNPRFAWRVLLEIARTRREPGSSAPSPSTMKPS
jgi:N-acetylglucosaminyldiphosphoundecaprenol N-acetyl-beta-D-mannosaminyltransferase